MRAVTVCLHFVFFKLFESKQISPPCLNKKKNYLELFGPLAVTNAPVFIPTHLTIEMTPQHMVESPSDQVQEKDKTK